jgi:integrase
MIKIHFYLKMDKIKSSGLCPIYAKIVLHNKSITLSTGKSILKERWEKTDHLRSVYKNPQEKVIKESLDIFHYKAINHYNRLLRENISFDVNDFKDELLDKPKQEVQKMSMLKIIDLHNDHFEKLVSIEERSPASLQKYRRVKSIIEDYNVKYYGNKDIEVSKINGAYIYNLESYMKFESNYNGKIGIENNSIVKYFKNLKTICNYAIKLDYLEKNPFNKYSGKINTLEAVFLNLEELSRIENKTFQIERLEKVKDIFLFSCYTGYAPVDALKLTKENIIKDNNNNLWINTKRQKTGVRANVPLLPPVLKIINKYQFSEDGLLPKISNQKMNAYLKEISDIVGINKKLTWYVARHTFATTVTLANGIKIENVSAMLGHTTIRQTQHYAKVQDISVFEDMKKIISKFDK